MERPTLYLVFLAPDPGVEALALPELQPLGDGLYLIAATRTRSQLYHAVKRRALPQRLLVAPLADDPKFKGMAPGALAWLRRSRRGSAPRSGDLPPAADDPLSAPAKPAARSPARHRR